jgi:hypothetical protein
VLLDHLSGPWLAAVDDELAARDRLRPLAERCAVGITQVVTGGPAPLVYHVSSHDGSVRAAWGPATPEDVRITEDRSVARAIAAGERNAREAFITGQVTITGDQQRLIAAQELLGALDEVMATVTARTRFGDA